MYWKNEFKINIPVIDAQHKQLFNTYAELILALRGGLRPEVVRDTLQRLQHYVARHFSIEEKYMKESGYQGLAEQAKEHHYFSDRFNVLFEEFQKTGLTPQLVKSMQTELVLWLQNHIGGLDQEFGKFYNSRETRNKRENE